MKKLSISLGIVVAVSAATASIAGAASHEAKPTVVESGAFSAQAIRAAARDIHASARSDQAIGQHVAAQARAGRLVDAKNVHAAILGSGVLTWETGAVPQDARFNRAISSDVRPEYAGTEGEVLELAYEAAEDPTAKALLPAGVLGVGMLGAAYSGGTRLSSTCQTWIVSNRSITGCYQKFKPTTDGSSTRDYYAYNRWATATGEQLFPFNAWPVYMDIRSRPYVGYESRTVGMTDYFPIDGTQLCNEGSSVDVTLGSLKLGIGLTNCADKYPIPNATTKTMGMIYDDGFIFGGPLSKGLDFEMEVFNWQNGAVPILADYNYAKFCTGTLLSCTGTLGKNGW